MSAGGVDILFRADTSSVETAAGKIETLSKRAADAQQRAADRMVADNNRFIQSIQRQVDTFGMSGTAMLRYEANLRGVSAAADPLIQKLNEMKAAQAAVNSQATGSGFKSITEGANSASHATAGMTRELIVLAHEASQGNLRRLGGSLLVLSEYSTAAQTAIRALAGPIGLVVGALGSLAAAAAIGAYEATQLSKALQISGNYAGTTAGQFSLMAREIAESTNTGVSGARTALEELVKSGQVGPQMLRPIATAVVQIEKLTGESSEAIAKDFAKMGDGVAKWAEEHNKAWNFMSGDQYAYIKRLEETGQKEQAEAAVMQMVNDHVKTLGADLGFLARSWQGVSEWASKAWDSMKNAGRPDTIEDSIAKQGQKVDSLRTQVWSQSLAKNPPARDTTAAQYANDDLRLMKMAQATQQQQAYAKAEEEAANKSRIAAINSRDRWREETKGASLATQEIEKYRKLTVEPLKGTANAISPAEQAATEAAIRKRYDPADTRAAKQLDTRYQDRLEALRAEGIKLDEAAKNWKLYGKSIDDSHLALVNLEIAQGKLKGLSPDKIDNLRKQASADDEKAKNNEQTRTQDKLAKELDERIAKLSAAANAQAMNSRQVEIANELNEAEQKGLVKNSAAWDEYARKVTAAVNKEADRKSAAEMDAYSKKVDDEIKKLNDETAAIGKGTLAHLQLAAALKIEEEARKRKQGASPEEAAAIDAQAAIEQARMSSAISTNYDAGRSSGAGVETAFQKYKESASDAAAFSSKVLDGGLQNIEDSLVKFVDTGKLSFSSLFKFMADEFLRNAIRMTLSGQGPAGALGAMFGAGGMLGGNAGGIGDKYNSGSTGFGGLLKSFSGLANTLGGAFGGSGLSISTAADGAEGAMGISAGYSAAADSALADLPALATGTNYVPYDGMAAVLHKGEAVVPAAYNPAAGGKGTGNVDAGFYGNVSVGSGVSRGDMHAAINQALGQHEMRIRRLNRQGALT